MSEKSSFLNWVGFKEGESAAPNSVDRIRELESQLADMRSRRDLTSLSKEEFEIALKTTTNISKHHPSNFQKKVISALNEKIEKVQKEFKIELSKEYV